MQSHCIAGTIQRTCSSLSLVVFAASKMWCLCRYLPVLIGAWIPEDHWKYGLFLLLLKMLDIIMAPVVTVHKAVFLRQLISEHHELFCELYPMATITPKMHYMIHLPTSSSSSLFFQSCNRSVARPMVF